MRALLNTVWLRQPPRSLHRAGSTACSACAHQWIAVPHATGSGDGGDGGELCCIVDEDNNVVGAESREKTVRECVPPCVRKRPSSSQACAALLVCADLHTRRRLWGRGAYVLVVDSSGTHLYVTRRAAHKDVYPGLLDTVTSGVVSAGETYEQTAARELREELALSTAQLTRLFLFRWVDTWCRVWGTAYVARCDATAVRHADGEVADGRWMPLADVFAHAASEPSAYTPVGLYVLSAFQQQQQQKQRSAAVGFPARRRRCIARPSARLQC